MERWNDGFFQTQYAMLTFIASLIDWKGHCVKR